MRPPRFSIAGLLVFIMVCGVAFAALASPSPLWANVVYTLAFAALVVAAIHLRFSRAGERAFWAGFLIAGGSYFAIYAVPALRESIGPRLATEAVLDFFYAAVERPKAPQAQLTATVVFNDVNLTMLNGQLVPPGAGGMSGMSATPTAVPPAPPPPVSRWAVWTTPDRSTGVGYPIGSLVLVSPEAFRQIGHSLFTLLFAATAGAYARRRYEARAVESAS